MFTEALQTLMRDRCTPAVVREIESLSHPASLESLAAALRESGFDALLAAEADGGGNASWPEYEEVVRACGAFALPLPLPQTMLARRLFAADELPLQSLLSFAPRLVREPGGALRATAVPFARSATHVAGTLEGDPAGTVLLLAVQDAQAVPTGRHASLCASLVWPGDSGVRLRCALDAPRLAALAAGLHASLLAGAMQRTMELTLAYANDRVQFGKSIGKFQAVQHQLSVMAEHVAAALLAAQAAFHTVEDGFPTVAACAAAKARTSEAAQVVASIAHAVHGAIGMAEEHDLQLYTRRLHEWRMAHGSESHWQRVLGRHWLDSDAQDNFTDFARSLYA